MIFLKCVTFQLHDSALWIGIDRIFGNLQWNSKSYGAYIQVYLKKLEYHEKGLYILSVISESETHIFYRFITHRVKYFKPLFLDILMIMAYRQWKPKIQSQKIRMLLKMFFTQCYSRMLLKIKKDILNRNVRLLNSMFISMHSILGWASFCMNYCTNAAWHGDNQPVALLRCNGSPGCFDSCLQVICIVGSGVSHLPLDNNP